MKLSEQTVNILKNFSTINQNILVKEGSDLRTMSTMKNIVAKAEIKEDIEQEFGVKFTNEEVAKMQNIDDLKKVLGGKLA